MGGYFLALYRTHGLPAELNQTKKVGITYKAKFNDIKQEESSMKKETIRYYALSIVFLAVAIIFYVKSTVSIGKFLLFFFCGFVCGINIYRGLNTSKKS